MITKAILKNDVKATYTDTIIPAGTQIDVLYTPPIALIKSITTNYDTFIYAVLVYKKNSESLHIPREDVEGGEDIKSKQQ